MTQILQDGVGEYAEREVPEEREMSFQDLCDDINNDFSARNLVSGKKGEMQDLEGGYPGYRIPINKRGRGQIFCLIAHFRSWYYRGTTRGYCTHCPFYQKQTSLGDPGLTEVCGKGFFVIEAN